MLLFGTKIMAIDPKDGKLKEWEGPVISEISFANATKYCQESGLGYCEVTKIIHSIENEDGSIIESYINTLNN